MFAFIDESYQESDNPGVFYTTYSAVCLERDRSRDFSRDLCNLKRTFWKINDPTEKELKGGLLLTDRALTMPKNREFMEQILALLRMHDIKVFAIISKGPQATLQGKNFLPKSFQFLIERVNFHASDINPALKTALVFDSIEDKSNRGIAENFTNFLYRHRFGESLENILDFPLFGDSLTTPGLQVADLVAYCTNGRYMGRRGYLEEIFVKMKELSLDWFNRRGDGNTDYGIRFCDLTNMLPGMSSL